MASPEQWLGKLANLKVDKARGDPAPHKLLLLPVVLELAEQKQAFGDILALTPELAFASALEALTALLLDVLNLVQDARQDRFAIAIAFLTHQREAGLCRPARKV